LIAIKGLKRESALGGFPFFFSACRFNKIGSKLMRPPGEIAIAEWF
jgi:hypothetical protein